jgi:hypothetical protein
MAKRLKIKDMHPTVLKSYGIPVPEIDTIKFHPKRKWRFDFAWPQQKVALELHGGVWNGGHHVRGQGFIDDREKMRAAQELGWIVLEYATGMVDYEQIKRVLEMRNGDTK